MENSMQKSSFLLAGAAALGLTALAVRSAQATATTYDFDFVGSNASNVFTNQPSADLTLDGTLTFDPTVSTAGYVSTGLDVTSSNFATSSNPFVYSYNATNGAFNLGNYVVNPGNGNASLPEPGGDLSGILTVGAGDAISFNGQLMRNFADPLTLIDSTDISGAFTAQTISTSVNEPATIAVLGAGLVALAALRRRSATRKECAL